ncbi:MAG: ACT domain-containing protein [Candidatus Margulisbacteria bacterium]|nr:ACT domain-containing protein [Candidatus Margulisiibacteriota bacterium]
MKIKQISVFIENKTGRLHDVAKVLSDNKINIRALSLAETSDFGVLRMIVDKPDEAVKVIKTNNFTVKITEVVAVEVPDKIGGLAGVLKIVDSASINIEYMYAFVEKKHENAILIFRFDKLGDVLETLKKKGLKILTEKEVLSL